MSVTEEQMLQRASEVRHYNRNAQQFLFILSGLAMLEAEDEDSGWFRFVDLPPVATQEGVLGEESL